MINYLNEERRHLDQLRQLFEADDPRQWPAPRPRDELTGLELLNLKEKSAGCSSAIQRKTHYPIRHYHPQQEN
jgi:rubrerythrin